MTAQQHLPQLSTGTDYESLAARFRPIFARIAEGALERERTRSLPHEPIRWLKEAGFGAVRVPREHGGAGASLPQLIQLLIVSKTHFPFTSRSRYVPPDQPVDQRT